MKGYSPDVSSGRNRGIAPVGSELGERRGRRFNPCIAQSKQFAAPDNPLIIMNNNTLTELMELQQIDIGIDEIRICISDINKKIAFSQDILKTVKGKIDAIKKEIIQSTILKKEKELAASDIDEQIRKHTMELNAIKSNNAYKALLSEINNSRQNKIKVEDEILVIMENEEQKSAEIKKLQDEYVNNEKEFNQNSTGFETEIKNNETKINDLIQQRNARAEKLPLNIIKQYENIRKNKKGPVVVEIKDFICGGCHRNLPLQVVDQVRQGKEIILCDHCQRILYQKT